MHKTRNNKKGRVISLESLDKLNNGALRVFLNHFKLRLHLIYKGFIST